MSRMHIHNLMNDYLSQHTRAKAWRVLNHVRANPTCISGLNRLELQVYKAIVANCGREIR